MIFNWLIGKLICSISLRAQEIYEKMSLFVILAFLLGFRLFLAEGPLRLRP